MLIEHCGKWPSIADSSFVASTATICGDVTIGQNCRIMYGATIIAEGGSIVIQNNCIVLENSVIRSTELHSTFIGSNVMIGPQTHLVGCRVGDNVFIATGASLFHGCEVKAHGEVRINGIVHIKTVLGEGETVPIGWVAVGNPAQIFPPEKHEDIWKNQEPLDFPMTVYGVDRNSKNVVGKITTRMAEFLESHKNDAVCE